ncbi:hypothetical protein PP175_10260 [Aneurinibacillus sp. Ricciae_BoGa-3]|uniref:hypothetical protein n=1 Tax=Aneurinibacillus sp. Ricciae_BoGa-3 TaxID=3022697 RepID=UPI00234247F6|nr:hypothetical protein [Aneurinibacillus sp. Ricciae_BoGa-3]WCK56261.1 hypothetical protein PP175_10260 [Aneurinibacillus sp. Ricciae_BoGa-3]
MGDRLKYHLKKAKLYGLLRKKYKYDNPQLYDRLKHSYHTVWESSGTDDWSDGAYSAAGWSGTGWPVGGSHGAGWQGMGWSSEGGPGN